MDRIKSPFTSAKHGRSAAALFAVVLALAGFANADGMYLTHSNKAKKGHLTIAAPTVVDGVILQAGNYEVREVNSQSGPVVEFARQFRNELASELVQADEEEVVARVNFTERALNALSKRTHLIPASGTAEAASLEIRGSAVGYEFSTSQTAGKMKEHPAAIGTNIGRQQ